MELQGGQGHPGRARGTQGKARGPPGSPGYPFPGFSLGPPGPPWVPLASKKVKKGSAFKERKVVTHVLRAIFKETAVTIKKIGSPEVYTYTWPWLPFQCDPGLDPPGLLLRESRRIQESRGGGQEGLFWAILASLGPPCPPGLALASF